MALPLAIAGIQAGLGLAQGITGLVQQNRAKKSLEELVKNRPYMGVPSAMEKYANEPISKQFINQQNKLSNMATGTGIGAMAKGGSRTMGGLNSLLQSYQNDMTSRYANFDQARSQAQLQLGQAQQQAQQNNLSVWNTQVQGAQQARAEGQQNIWQGAGNVARGLAYGLDNMGEGTSDNAGVSYETYSQIHKPIRLDIPTMTRPSLGGGFNYLNR